MDSEKIYNLLDIMYLEIQSLHQGQTEIKQEILDNKKAIEKNSTAIEKVRFNVVNLENNLARKVDVLSDADSRTQDMLRNIDNKIDTLFYKQENTDKEIFNIKVKTGLL